MRAALRIAVLLWCLYGAVVIVAGLISGLIWMVHNV